MRSYLKGGVNVVEELKAADFDALVAKAENPVILDFTADW
jgi:thiol:disulfide interchange protein